MATFIPVLRMVIGSSYLKTANENTNILFYEDAIVVNNNRIEINNQNKKWIKSLKVIPSKEMALLEFTIEWQTSKGRTFEEFRFPITDNYKTEVTSLIDRYKS